MRKWILASAAVLALAGAVSAVSAAPGDPPPATQPTPPHPGMMPPPEMMQMMLDARIGGMKAALRLSADQEKLWGPFESAVRDVAKARQDAMREMHDRMEKGERPSPVEHMGLMADHLAKAAAGMKQVADAAKPLYDALNDVQKRDFAMLLNTLHPEPHGGPGPHGPHGEGGPMGPHMGGMNPHQGDWGPPMGEE